MTPFYFLLDSPGKVPVLIDLIKRSTTAVREHPLEVIVRAPRKEKSHDQRKLFHALCAEAAPQLGLTPNETKQLFKVEFFGVEHRTINGRVYEFVQGSEELDRPEYSRLIDFVYQFLAQQGIVLQDRRSTMGEGT